MPQLGIAKEFLSDYAKLEKPVQKAVDATIAKFSHHTHVGVHLEKLAKAKDPRIRTIRITQFYRGVVLAPDCGDEFYLITVLPHDDAISYALTRRFTVNQKLGVLEVRDQEALDVVESTLSAGESGLFDDVKDSELTRLGVDADVLPIVRLLRSDLELQALARLLPTVQYDALVGLASGMTPDQVWTEVSASLYPAAAPEHIDPDDLSAAATRTPDRFVMIEGPAALADILAHPFDAWRTFLHPKQREVAYRPSYAGPALVTGGAGTGKTVTALHRAVHLARAGQPVLLTTFTRNLAEALERQLALLTDEPAVLGRIEVTNVDRLAYRIAAEELGGHPAIATPQTLSELWAAAASPSPEWTPVFLQQEWEQVVLGHAVTDIDEYLRVRRHGRGTPLRNQQRLTVWAAIQRFVSALRERGEYTYWQLSEIAADALTRRGTQPYRHVLVDEGQDLHPTQWRLLRAAAPADADDLFIVSDPHQRIYDNRVSLASLGINVRGRSRSLHINYRTTQEILAWAVRLLAGDTFTGLDDDADTLTGYHSPMHGADPMVHGHRDRDRELAALIERVKAWLDDGIEAHAIGVAARNGFLVRTVSDALTKAGIDTATTKTGRPTGVRVGTMHSMKGLEFRCLAAVGIDASTVPARSAVTAADVDPLAHEQDLQRERCLLFVACTRARDELYVSYAGRPSPLLPSA